MPGTRERGAGFLFGLMKMFWSLVVMAMAV